MDQQTTNRLADLREQMDRAYRLRESRVQTEDTLHQAAAKLDLLETYVDMLASDIQELEGFTLNSFWLTIIGARARTIDQKRDEQQEASKELEACTRTVKAMQKELEEIDGQVTGLTELELEYKTLLEKKERMLSAADDEGSRALQDANARLESAKDHARRVRKACDAGNAVLMERRTASSVILQATRKKGYRGSIVLSAAMNTWHDSRASAALGPVHAALIRFREAVEEGGLERDANNPDELDDRYTRVVGLCEGSPESLSMPGGKGVDPLAEIDVLLQGYVGDLQDGLKVAEKQIEELDEERRRVIESV
jgi:chromosome segregation ATPase